MPQDSSNFRHSERSVSSLTQTGSRALPSSSRVLNLCAVFMLTWLAATLPAAAQVQQLPDDPTKALFLAVDRNDLEAARRALTQGADIEGRDYSGTQPVDMAIDRGYFDVARFLISVRNTQRAQRSGSAPAPTPSMPELSQMAQSRGVFKGAANLAVSQETAPDPGPGRVSETPATAAPPPPASPPTPFTNNPFAVAPSTPPGGAPGVTITAPAPVDTPLVVTPPVAVPDAQTEVAEKPSAVKTFITTFFNFFEPPNVTGVTRRETDRSQPADSLSDAELARQLKEIEAERGDVPIRGPEVPISPDELAQEFPVSPELTPPPTPSVAAPTAVPAPLPAYAVEDNPMLPSSPVGNDADAFGDFEVSTADEGDNPFAATDNPFAQSAPPTPETTQIKTGKTAFKQAPGVPGKPYNPSRPFGGGVDPDVLAFLNLDARTGDPLEVADNSQAFGGDTSEDDTMENPFEDLNSGTTPAVSDLLEGLGEAQNVAPKPVQAVPESDNPFADPAPGGGANELSGLLETTDEATGWDVKKVDGATLPDQVVVLSELEPTGEILDATPLSIGENIKLNQEISPERLGLLTQKTTDKTCVAKESTDTIFCINTVSWPLELEESFLVDTIMYQGTSAIARYDAGRATNFQALFRSSSFVNVISYYTGRYGQPGQIIERAIAPLAAPRQANPTYLWQSRDPGTDSITTLEVRKFDDTQGGGFPDVKRGVIMLYRNFAKPIFPQLSQLELMVLKNNDTVANNAAANGQDAFDKEPADIWN